MDSGMSSPASAMPAITSPRKFARGYCGSHSVIGMSFIAFGGVQQLYQRSIGERTAIAVRKNSSGLIRPCFILSYEWNCEKVGVPTDVATGFKSWGLSPA